MDGVECVERQEESEKRDDNELLLIVVPWTLPHEIGDVWKWKFSEEILLNVDTANREAAIESGRENLWFVGGWI